MSRILNRQRQLAEQGRLRLGYTVPATRRDGTPTTRPVRSETWVVTSHSREHVEHAANLWGGEAQEWEPMGNGAKQWRVITQTSAIPAILPPGDPLTQAYEQWGRGGCVRRCDGVTEELSGSPCICLAQHGEGWYELSTREVCGSKSRLKVLLPDMPGLGSWRMETGSFYATDEIAGMVDTIRGAAGDSVLIPVTLRIEPRTRVAGGETKQFVVPVLELRGVTAGALLSGQAVETGALRSGNLESARPAALQASDPYGPFFDRLPAASSLDELSALWGEMVEAKLVGVHAAPSQRGAEFLQAFKDRAAQLKPEPPVEQAAPAQAAAAAEPVANADGTYDAEWTEESVASEQQPAPAQDMSDVDPDMVWQQILAAAGRMSPPMTTAEVQGNFQQRMGGLMAESAGAAELQHYLGLLTGQGVAA